MQRSQENKQERQVNGQYWRDVFGVWSVDIVTYHSNGRTGGCYIYDNAACDFPTENYIEGSNPHPECV